MKLHAVVTVLFHFFQWLVVKTETDRNVYFWLCGTEKILFALELGLNAVS